VTIMREKPLNVAMDLAHVLGGGADGSSSVFRQLNDQMNVEAEFLTAKLSAESDKTMAEGEMKLWGSMKERKDVLITQLVSDVEHFKNEISQMRRAPALTQKKKLQLVKENVEAIEDARDKARKSMYDTAMKNMADLQTLQTECGVVMMEATKEANRKRKNHLVFILAPSDLDNEEADKVWALVDKVKMRRSHLEDPDIILGDMISLVYFASNGKVITAATMSWKDFEQKYQEVRDDCKKERVDLDWEKAWKDALSLVTQVCTDVKNKLGNTDEGGKSTCHLNTIVVACLSCGNAKAESTARSMISKTKTAFNQTLGKLLFKSQSTMKELWMVSNKLANGPGGHDLRSSTVFWMVSKAKQDLTPANIAKFERWGKEANGGKLVWSTPDAKQRPFLHYGKKNSTWDAIGELVCDIAAVGPISASERKILEMENRQQELLRLSTDSRVEKVQLIADMNKKCSKILLDHANERRGDGGAQVLEENTTSFIESTQAFIDKLEEDVEAEKSKEIVWLSRFKTFQTKQPLLQISSQRWTKS